MTLNSKSIVKAQRIANRCREVKGWKGGSISARAEKGGTGDLYIYAMIGSSWFEEGITAESVRVALEGLKGVKTLNIFINCEGGDVFEAKAIYTQLKRFAAEKVVHIDGIAASAATFIAMAGDKIITSPAATWMVHEAWTVAMGNACDMRDSADLLDMMNSDIADIYAERTGRTCEEMSALMSKETWMNAEQALAEKFTDEIASFNEDNDEDEEIAAANSSKVVSAVEATHARIAAMTSELLTYRKNKANDKLKQDQMKNESSRASAVAVKQQRPASR